MDTDTIRTVVRIGIKQRFFIMLQEFLSPVNGRNSERTGVNEREETVTELSDSVS